MISGGLRDEVPRVPEPAVIDIRRHNANFCAEHFLRLCRDQVAKAIDQFEMIEPGERVLVAVSGGKDSLALWDILLDLGYEADGLYLGLGIGDYSDESGGYARAFAGARGPHARRGRPAATTTATTSPPGPGRPGGCRARRAGCPSATCSTRPRSTAATTWWPPGHNLDDEAAVLFGNVLRWRTEYLGRQLPVLPGGDGFPRKVKPLVRLGEREMAAYCVLRGIDYIVEECPMAAGNRHLGYKEALNAIEARSPGRQARFYFGFLARAAPVFAPEAEAEQDDLGPCRVVRRAHHRARCAPSAAWSSGRAAVPSRPPVAVRAVPDPSRPTPSGAEPRRRARDEPGLRRRASGSCSSTARTAGTWSP